MSIDHKRILLAAFTLLAAFGTGHAAASEVAIDPKRNGALVVTADPGERNAITVSARSERTESLEVRVADAISPLRAGRGCSPRGQHAVTCLANTKSWRLTVFASLGGGGDSFQASSLTPGDPFSTIAVDGEGGDDLIAIGSPGDVIRPYGWLRGGAGADTIEAGGGEDHVVGESGPDVVRGGGGEDAMLLGPGDDRAGGGGGDDRIVLGPGDDRARGGPGADSIEGETGEDRIGGGGEADILRGGGGSDELLGGGGADVILAGRVGPGQEAPIELSSDLVECGGGEDRAEVNAWDRASDCEERSLRRLVRLFQPRGNAGTGAVALPVETVGRGRVTIQGPAVKPVAGVTRDVGWGPAHCEAKLRINVRGSALAALRREGEVTVRLRVGFQPAAGGGRSEARWLRLVRR